MLRPDPITQTSKEDVLFGRLAVREGILTQEQLNTCLRLQAQPGEKRSLGEILVAQALLSAEEVIALLAKQSKKIMSCPTCKISFTVHTISKGKTIACPRCQGALREGKPSDSVRVDAELKSDSVLTKLREGKQGERRAPRPAARAAGPCPICKKRSIGPLDSDGRVECLSCHARFIP
jgi:DNA-directed RNA polymerase subunit RPC12/RpoP